MKKLQSLIVDDDPVSSLAFSRQLQAFNIEVISVLNLKLAQIALESYKIDLIFLDLILNDESGIEFLKKRKTDPYLSSIPVIVTSAKADLKSIREALLENADDYIIKPVQLRLLKQTLSRFKVEF